MLTSCCYFFTLKKGCFIIAISTALMYGLSAFTMALFLTNQLPEAMLNEYLNSNVQLRIFIGSVVMLLSACSLIYGTFQEIPFFRNPLAIASLYSHPQHAAHILCGHL